jgi:PE-PPE domain
MDILRYRESKFTYSDHWSKGSEVTFAKSVRKLSQSIGASGAAVALILAGTSPGAPAVHSALRTAYTAEVRLTGTTIGVGGSFEGFGLTIPAYFYGKIVPEGDTYHSVPYPGSINLNYPILSDLPGLSDLPYWPQSMTKSTDKGASFVLTDLKKVPAGEKVTLAGLSQGAQVLEVVRAAMANDPAYVANAQNYNFTLLGNPSRPVGGMLTRLGFLSQVPVLNDLFPFGRPGPVDSPFKTVDYQNQYDGFADFPAYFNPLAITNSLVGIAFEHIFPGYALDNPNNPNAVSTTVGNTTYVTIPQLLPILYPFHVAAATIGAQRFVDFLDPVLRVFVEAGYDRTADPSKVQQLSLFTPISKIVQAIGQLPAAIAESMAILGGKPYNPTVPAPIVPGQAVDPTATTTGTAEAVGAETTTALSPTGVTGLATPVKAGPTGLIGLQSVPVIGPIIKAITATLPKALGNLLATIASNPNTVLGRIVTALAGTPNNAPPATVTAQSPEKPAADTNPHTVAAVPASREVDSAKATPAQLTAKSAPHSATAAPETNSSAAHTPPPAAATGTGAQVHETVATQTPQAEESKATAATAPENQEPAGKAATPPTSSPEATATSPKSTTLTSPKNGTAKPIAHEGVSSSAVSAPDVTATSPKSTTLTSPKNGAATAEATSGRKEAATSTSGSGRPEHASAASDNSPQAKSASPVTDKSNGSAQPSSSGPDSEHQSSTAGAGGPSSHSTGSHAGSAPKASKAAA